MATGWILKQFGASRAKAQKAYRKFVSEGRGVTVWENLRGQVYLGSDAFIEEYAPTRTTVSEIPQAQLLAARPALLDIVSDPDDAAGIACAYLEHRYTQQEIAAHLGVHYSTISRRVRAHEGVTRRRRNA